MRVIRTALEECLDLDQCIRFPDAEDWQPAGTQTRYRLHEAWHLAADGAAVASLPLRLEDRAVAVLGIRAMPGATLDRETLESIEAQVQPFAPALLLVERASRGLPAHTQTAIRSTLSRGFSRRGTRLRLALLAVVLLAAWLGFGTLPREITATAQVVPREVRHVIAPFDARITRVGTASGDVVPVGSLLFTLDASELEFQRRELRAELDAARLERDQAVAAARHADAAVADSRTRALAARLDLIEHQIDTAEVVAPFDAVVLEGELDDRLGQLVRRGDTLVRLAPQQATAVEIQVPEHLVDEVRPGFAATFATAARPDTPLDSTLESVHPEARAEEGRTVFRVRAELEEAAWLRPGMEGVARIRVGEGRPWQVVSDRLVDWVRRRFWW